MSAEPVTFTAKYRHATLGDIDVTFELKITEISYPGTSNGAPTGDFMSQVIDFVKSPPGLATAGAIGLIALKKGGRK